MSEEIVVNKTQSINKRFIYLFINERFFYKNYDFLFNFEKKFNKKYKSDGFKNRELNIKLKM